ncbi:MAG: hypothetical protein ACXWJD_04255 [Burkholderiaceae bacterium]
MSSLEFATAIAESTDVKLVHWKVEKDPCFCEHWAISISEEEVIDLTRVQVDGSTEVLHLSANYPTNYKNKKEYPLSVAWATSQKFLGPPQIESLRPTTLKIRYAMICHDLKCASHNSKHKVLVHGAYEMLRVSVWLFSSRLKRRLELRRDRLKSRLERH